MKKINIFNIIKIYQKNHTKNVLLNNKRRKLYSKLLNKLKKGFKKINLTHSIFWFATALPE